MKNQPQHSIAIITKEIESSFFLPNNIFNSVYDTTPKTAPAVIEKHNGIIIIVKNDATISSNFSNSTLRICENISNPTSIKIGAVAILGMALISGAINTNGIHNKAVTTDAKPVVAPF